MERKVIIQEQGWYLDADGNRWYFRGSKFISGTLCPLYDTNNNEKLFFTTGKGLLYDKNKYITKYLSPSEYPELYL